MVKKIRKTTPKKHRKVKLINKLTYKYMITNVTVTNDDGTTQVFTPEGTSPSAPEVIAVPLDTDIKIVAR